MAKKTILVISGVIVLIGCSLLILIFLNLTRDNEIYSMGSAIYPNATMDILIDDAQYIALVEVMDEGNIIKYQEDVTELDGSISKVTHINIDTTLKVLESYKGTFESNEIIYRNNNGAVGNVIKGNNTDHPSFVKGEKLILFMWKEPKDNTYYLYYGIQGAFKFDDIEKKYINSNNVKFTNMKTEIEKFNNKALEERELAQKGNFFENI